jgi:hypothetical protein
MLTTMKTNVLKRAAETMNQPAPAGRTRTRIVGITIAIVSLLAVGSAGAALATGIIPSPFTAPESPVTSSTPSPLITPTTTPSATPAPTIEPDPTSALNPSDPSTWTIGPDEIAGVPVGGSLSSLAEGAALEPITDTIDCSPGYSNGPGFDDPAGVRITLAEMKSRGTAVADPTFTYAYVWTRTTPPTVLSGSPTTDEGVRLGTSEADLLAAYPDLQRTTSRYDSTVGYTTYADGPNNEGRYLVFQTGTADSGARTVVSIQSSTLSTVIDLCD